MVELTVRFTGALRLQASPSLIIKITMSAYYNCFSQQSSALKSSLTGMNKESLACCATAFE